MEQLTSTPATSVTNRNLHSVTPILPSILSKDKKILDFQGLDETTDSTFLGFSNGLSPRNTNPENVQSSFTDTSTMSSPSRTVVNKTQDNPATPHSELVLTKDQLKVEILDIIHGDSFKSVLTETFESVAKNLINETNINVSSLSTRVDQHDDQFNTMDSRISTLEQNIRQKNLVISGLPEVPGENLTNKLLEIVAFLGIEICVEDIESIFRMGMLRDRSSRPRLVHVKFFRKDQRDRIYLARAKLRGYQNLTIFLNEDLTPQKANLFFKARQKAKALGWFSTWTFGNVIYMKQSKDVTPIRITTSHDIDRL